MAIEQEFAHLEKYFRGVYVNLSLSEDHSKFILLSNMAKYWFRIPPMVEANNNKIPGWFLAGVWDTMQLPDLNRSPDEALLRKWKFTSDAGVWRLTISGVEQLVYNPATSMLSIQNYSAGSTTDITTFPTKSIFHVRKLFEENGWFSGEGQVESLDIRDFLLR